MPKRLWIGFLSFFHRVSPRSGRGRNPWASCLQQLFTAGLNLAIVARWIWTEAFPPGWAEFFTLLSLPHLDGERRVTPSWWVWLLPCRSGTGERSTDSFVTRWKTYMQGDRNDSRKSHRADPGDGRDRRRCTLAARNDLTIQTSSSIASPRRAFRRVPGAGGRGEMAMGGRAGTSPDGREVIVPRRRANLDRRV